MPRYVIERNIPDAGQLTQPQLQAISQKSCEVLAGMPDVHWIESFVTDDRIYCIYVAPDEASIRTHAERGGFPANRISEIKNRIDPGSANA